MGSPHPRHRARPFWATAQRLGFANGAITVFLNGVDTIAYGWGIIETLFGAPGWVVYEKLGIPHRILDPTAPHANQWSQCQCGSGQACLQVAHGMVTTSAMDSGRFLRVPRMVAPGVWVLEIQAG